MRSLKHSSYTRADYSVDMSASSPREIPVMKLGALTRSLYDRPLDKALMWLATQGLEAAEIGCGAYDGTKHCNAKVLLRNPDKLKQFQWVVRESGLSISALACHANPIHPSQGFAAAHREDQRNATILAEKLGVDTVTVMAEVPTGKEHWIPNALTWILPGISGLEKRRIRRPSGSGGRR